MGAARVRATGGRSARTPRVTLIPGDGIGPEVTAVAVSVIAAAGGRVEWETQTAGKAAAERYGTPIPDPLIA